MPHGIAPYSLLIPRQGKLDTAHFSIQSLVRPSSLTKASRMNRAGVARIITICAILIPPTDTTAIWTRTVELYVLAVNLHTFPRTGETNGHSRIILEYNFP